MPTGSPARPSNASKPSNFSAELSMAIPALPKDFNEFLKSLNSNLVEYLLIGGYAVGIYGHIRATNDLDIWVLCSEENAAKVCLAVREFGFPAPGLTPELFLAPNNIVRMGLPPIRIEILTTISGVEFEKYYAERRMFQIDDITVPVINLAHLRQNKAARARAKDLADLESLPTDS